MNLQQEKCKKIQRCITTNSKLQYLVGHYCTFIYSDFITEKVFKSKKKAREYKKKHTTRNKRLIVNKRIIHE